jgi:hypothetical protein
MAISKKFRVCCHKSPTRARGEPPDCRRLSGATAGASLAQPAVRHLAGLPAVAHCQAE